MSPFTAAIQDVTILQSVVKAHFAALADGNLSRVPWAENVNLRAPLAQQSPISGRRTAEDYLRPLAGHLGEIRIRQISISPAKDATAVDAIVGPLHVLDKFVIKDGQIVEQHNFYDPRPILDAPSPGGLSKEERLLSLERLENSRSAIRELLTSASSEALTHRPIDGGWTALECAEHLVLSEQALLRIVREMLCASPDPPSLPLHLRGRDRVVVAAMSDRSGKTKTFDFLAPKGAYSSAATVLDAFLVRRADTINFVRRAKVALKHHAAPFQGQGHLDAYHWLLLIAAHTDRHLEQMREAIRQCSCPSA